jgi:XTP/dITP diphosphohydrolase
VSQVPAVLTPLLVASTNPGKIREILRILEGLPVSLRTLANFSGIEVPDETGATFMENARIKALHYAAATGLLTVAEDSGLEIPALGGAPGVYSARYRGETYPEKFAALYEELDRRGDPDRSARFVAALALARGGSILFEATGVVEGSIARPPRGDRGFGYDPILYYPPLGKTTGELEPHEKAAISHRGKAFRALRVFLERFTTEDAEDTENFRSGITTEDAEYTENIS